MSEPNPLQVENKKSTIDGGFVALSGFFFQMLALFADTVPTSLLSEGCDSKDSGLGAGNAIIGHEIGDMDGVSIEGNKVRILQVKFSNDSSKDIAPAELDGILEKMVQFADKSFPESGGWTRVFVLLTNRNKSESIIDYEKGKIEIKPTEGREYKWFNSYYAQLEWIVKAQEDCWVTIEEWGRSFGMKGNHADGEIQQGVARVFYRFLKEVVERKGWLTPSELERTFAGYENPRRLRQEEIRQAVLEDIEQFLNSAELDLVLSEGEGLLRREKVDEITAALAQFRVVVIEGKGGNGKSTLLANVLLNRGKVAFSTGRLAIDLTNEYWPSDRIRYWRNNLDATLELTPDALKRLPPHWPSVPIVIFALDSLDEANVNYSFIRQLVTEVELLPQNWQSRISLLLTCRDHSKIDFLKRLAKQNSHCIVIDTDVFSNAELRENLLMGRPNLSAAIRNELLSMISDGDLSERYDLSNVRSSINFDGPYYGGDSLQMISEPIYESDVSRQQELLETLRHPIVWKHFCSKEIDDHTRFLILHGDHDDQSWGILAREIFQWFGEKCQQRIIGRPPSAVRESKVALLAVASACPDPKGSYKRADWDNAGSQPHLMSNLFEQAVSSGLVIGDPDDLTDNMSWSWRHAFFVRFLVGIGRN